MMQQIPQVDCISTRWDIEMASPVQQAQRREHTYALLRDLYRSRMTHDTGGVLMPVQLLGAAIDHADKRLNLWLARAFFHGSPADCQLANDLIVSIQFNHPCHFCAEVTAILLVAYAEKLQPATREHLEQFFLRNYADWMTKDYRFHGANDNAPAGCVTAVALGGRYFRNAALVEFARTRLHALDHLLDLRGYIHEGNSPTYSAHTLNSLAELAEYTTDPDIRGMALRAEQRVWQELLVHFHPTIRHQVGPYTRAYPDDSANQCTMVMMAMYAAFGEITPFNPLAMLFPLAPGTFAHNSWDFQYCELAAMSAPTYHPPCALADDCLNARELPADSIGNNEYMGGWGVPGGQTTVVSHLEPEFGLGSFGSRVWAGQTVPLHLLYRRRTVSEHAGIVDQLAAIRSIYTRMLVTDRLETMYDRSLTVENDIASDQGAAFSVQQESTVLLGYVPVKPANDVRTIRTSVVVPMHHSHPDELWYGDQQLPGFSGSFETLDWCFLRDGEVYLAVYPLLSVRSDLDFCGMQFSDAGTYGLISFYNMCCFAPHTLTRDAMHERGSGMVCEVGTARQYGTFEHFRKAMCRARITNDQWGSERTLCYRRDHISLELQYDFLQLNLRRAVSGGQLVPEHIRLQTEPVLPLTW